MFTLFQTPVWFQGLDLVFDLIAVLITLTITLYSSRIYHLSGEKKFFYFAVAFGLMSLGFVSKLITFSVIYAASAKFAVARTIEVVSGLPQGVGLSYRNLLYRAGFFLQMAATMGSLLLLYLLSQKARDRLNKMYEVSQIGLFTYLILLLAVVSTFEYRVFYLTNLVMLGLIVMHYYKNYLMSRSKHALRVMWSFGSLMIAQVFFLFIFVMPGLYFIGELFTLLGFGLILYTYVSIQKQVGGSKLVGGDE